MPPIEPIEVASGRFGTYVLRSRLGAGGMAEVFLAETRDEAGDPFEVALKLMRADVTEQAFADEADLMALLHHPNLVRLLEVGEAFGRPFIAMELLVGGDLRRLINAHRSQSLEFPESIALTIVIELLKGLGYFHQARSASGAALGLVHGDVNPTNVFFSADGDVKLGDFGVAKSRTANIGPRDGVSAGKLSYLSPEQARGEPPTPASDLYSVGLVLHELLVGYHPFQGQGQGGGQGLGRPMMSVLKPTKVAIPAFIDPPLADILQRSLNPDLRGRYKTAGELAGALLHYALDRNLLCQRAEIRERLSDVLGLLL